MWARKHLDPHFHSDSDKGGKAPNALKWHDDNQPTMTETDAPLPTSHFTEMKFQITVLLNKLLFWRAAGPSPPALSNNACRPKIACCTDFFFLIFFCSWPTGTFSLKELCCCHVPGCLESVPLDTVSRSRCGPHASNPNWCSAYYIPNHRTLHWNHISLQSEACLKWFFTQELWGIGKKHIQLTKQWKKIFKFLKYLICHNQQLWNSYKKSKEITIFSFLVC